MAQHTQRVSIISPAYNAAKSVKATIDSVIAQTHEDWEMLIADDCSSDNTIEIVEAHCQLDSRIKLFTNPENLGPAGTRNRLLQEASGRLIAFLDTDDRWLPQKLEKQLAALEETDASICCTGYSREFPDKHIELIPPPRIDYKDLLKSNHIPMLTALVDRERTGDFLFDVKGHEDYQLWLNVTRSGHWAVTVQEVLAVYKAGIGTGSVSGHKLKAARWHWDIMSKEPIAFPRKLINFGHYMFRGLRKYV